MTEREIDEALSKFTQLGLLRAVLIGDEIYYEPTEEGVRVVELLQNGHHQVEAN